MAEDLRINIIGDATKLQSALGQAGKGVTSFADKIGKIGKTMTIAGAAITAAFGLTVKAAINFNKEIANIATLIPGSTKRVNELKSAIRDMAIKVGKDTADLAQGAYQVISAWGDTADTVGILGIAAKAATAGVAMTTEAINLLSAVTKGYGDTSVEAVQKASDLAFQTVTLGQTTFPELAASIGKVIPLTSELGVSQEELFAVMATGTGVTGKAAEVSTQLRGIMQSLMSPTADMTKLLDEKEYASGKAMLADLGLAGALDVIKSAAEASNLPLQKYISSIEGQTLALALTGTQADSYIKKLAAMKDSMGLTDIAFKEQTEGVNKAGFVFNQVKQQMIVAIQEIGDMLLPMITPVIEKVTEIIGKLREWTDAHKPLMEWLVKIAAFLGVMAAVGGPILLAASTFMKAKVAVDAVTTALRFMNVRIALTGSLTTGSFIPALAKLDMTVLDLATHFALVAANVYIWIKVFGEVNEILHSHHIRTKDVEEATNRLSEVQEMLAERLEITVEELKEFQEAGASVSEMLGITVEELEEATKGFKYFLEGFEGIAEIGKLLQPAREAIQEIIDTMTPYEKQLVAINKRYDEVIEKITTYITGEKELKAAIDELNEGRKAEIILLNRQRTAIEKVSEAKKKLADMTKTLTDKIWEFTATEEEIKLRDINREYDLLIENAKEAFKGKKELTAAIKAINEERKEQITILKELYGAKEKDVKITKKQTEKEKELIKIIGELKEKLKEAGEVGKEAGEETEESWGRVVVAIYRAGKALTDFSIKGIAAAIANVRMKYYPMIAEMQKDILEFGDYWGMLASSIARMRKDMQLQIDTILYGFKMYNQVLTDLGGTTEETTNSMVNSWKKVENAIVNIAEAVGNVGTPLAEGTPGVWGARSYGEGIRSVPRTGLALVHVGEEINPPGQRSYDQRKYSNVVNIYNPIVRSDDDINKIERSIKDILDKDSQERLRQGNEITLGV